MNIRMPKTILAVGCLLPLASCAVADGAMPPALLQGCHPDPTICQADGKYYMTVSSNTWYPGLPVYESADLRTWKLVSHAADGEAWAHLWGAQYREWGVTDNFGLWAPTIRHHAGTFYVICTLLSENCVPRRHFIVTAKNPAGPWSPPLWVKGSRGYDPSLFFDRDGKVYLLSTGGVRKSKTGSGAVAMAEIDLVTGAVKGEYRTLSEGLGERSVAVEAPHLYRIRDKYLLILAEGGTERGHCTAAFVSDAVWGPYRPCAHNPVITARGQGENVALRNKGHADLVRTPAGELYAVFLGVRGEPGRKDYPFGRESFLCKASFDGENLRFDDGHLLAGTLEEPRTYYRTSVKDCELRRLLALEDSETRVVRDDPRYARAGVAFSYSSQSTLLLAKGKASVDLVSRAHHRERILATVPYTNAVAVLRVALRDATLTFGCGPSADRLAPVGKPVPFENLRNVGLYFNGPGIGRFSEKAFPAVADFPEPIRLWSDVSMPHDRLCERMESGTDTVRTDVDVPRMYAFPASGEGLKPCVLICPGGGYRELDFRRGGADLARRWNGEGVSAFVLFYRVDRWNPNPNGALADAQQALRLIRANAAHYGVLSNCVAMTGCLAGANLTARTSCSEVRPDFAFVVHPDASHSYELHWAERKHPVTPRAGWEDMIPAWARQLKACAGSAQSSDRRGDALNAAKAWSVNSWAKRTALGEEAAGDFIDEGACVTVASPADPKPREACNVTTRDWLALEPQATYRLSCWVDVDREGPFSLGVNSWNGQYKRHYYTSHTFPGVPGWRHYVWTFETPSVADYPVFETKKTRGTIGFTPELGVRRLRARDWKLERITP